MYTGVATHVPLLAVAAVCLYLPGIALWSVFALRCKADTFIFLSTGAFVCLGSASDVCVSWGA